MRHPEVMSFIRSESFPPGVGSLDGWGLGSAVVSNSKGLNCSACSGSSGFRKGHSGSKQKCEFDYRRFSLSILRKQMPSLFDAALRRSSAEIQEHQSLITGIPHVPRQENSETSNMSRSQFGVTIRKVTQSFEVLVQNVSS